MYSFLVRYMRNWDNDWTAGEESGTAAARMCHAAPSPSHHSGVAGRPTGNVTGDAHRVFVLFFLLLASLLLNANTAVSTANSSAEDKSSAIFFA